MTFEEPAVAAGPCGRRRQPVHDEGIRSLAHLFPDVTAQRDPDKNTLLPSQVRPGSNRPIWWLCENGHSWSAAP
ncbi:zinc-ribbon domain-containing protein [Pseudarthrobacter sp. S9]|uniref:zinc-ribbon domain-containing protein n=1 Tax=Pseudarthrobacter sp. S9 TaxID=3418421 RepID=UPI003D0627C9